LSVSKKKRLTRSELEAEREYRAEKERVRHTNIPDYLENADWFQFLEDCDCKPNGEENY
jgi:hypothetical protein